MSINPFHEVPQGLNPDDEAFLKEFGGLERGGNTVIQAPTTEEGEIPAEEALNLGISAEQREAFLNELVDIAPGFKIPRKEYEAVVEIFKRINENMSDGRELLIENYIGDEKDGKRIQVKENHVICLDIWNTSIQSLDGAILPERLKVLQLSKTSIQSLDGVMLPEELQELDLTETPIQSLAGVKLPGGLKNLYLSRTLIQSLDGVTLPQGLQELYLNSTSIQSLNGIKLPEGLQKLYLNSTSIQSLDGVILPEGLQSLRLSETPIQSLDGVILPKGLKEVYLRATPLSQNHQKMNELEARYPNIELKY